MLIVGKILAAIVLPPGIFMLLTLLCVYFAIKGMKKAAVITGVVNTLAIYLLSTVSLSSLLVSPLENKYPPIVSRGDARAVVVLGGGYTEHSPEYGGMGTLSIDSVKRAVYGVELSRKFDLPLVYSGGRSYDSSQPGSEAEAAGRLWRMLGVASDRMTLETESKDTKENAKKVASLVGTGTFILVTTAMHMPRSVLAFEKTGLRVIAGPTDYRAKRSPTTWSDFLPSTSCLQDSRFALHEYIGLLYYRLTFSGR